jgi:hypothetical protein
MLTELQIECSRPCKTLLTLCLFAMLAGCGVKGKPLPPQRPPEIGRGAPTYKRTGAELQPSVAPSPAPATRPEASP